MKNSIFLLTLLFSISTLCAQVGISANNDFVPHEDAALHVEGVNKTVILPKADNPKAFPLYDDSQPDDYTDDPGLAGAIIYNESDESIYQYDGQKWVSSDALMYSLKTPQLAHFTRNGNVRLGSCSPCNTVIVPFVSNTSQDFNNIPSDIVMLTGGQFRVNTKGVYRVSFKSPLSILRSGLEQFVSFTANVLVELQVSKNGGSSWTTYSSNNFDENGGVIGGITINNSIRANLSLSTAINLDANDLIRFRVSGERSVYPFGPNYIDMDTPSTGAIGEVIFEKVNFN